MGPCNGIQIDIPRDEMKIRRLDRLVELLSNVNWVAYTSFMTGGDVQSLLKVSKLEDKSISQPSHFIDQEIRKVDSLAQQQFRLPMHYIELPFLQIWVVEFAVEPDSVQ
jgi:hypothetical protein